MLTEDLTKKCLLCITTDTRYARLVRAAVCQLATQLATVCCCMGEMDVTSYAPFERPHALELSEGQRAKGDRFIYVQETTLLDI